MEILQLDYFSQLSLLKMIVLLTIPLRMIAIIFDKIQVFFSVQLTSSLKRCVQFHVEMEREPMNSIAAIRYLLKHVLNVYEVGAKLSND